MSKGDPCSDCRFGIVRSNRGKRCAECAEANRCGEPSERAEELMAGMQERAEMRESRLDSDDA